MRVNIYVDAHFCSKCQPKCGSDRLFWDPMDLEPDGFGTRWIWDPMDLGPDWDPMDLEPDGFGTRWIWDPDLSPRFGPPTWAPDEAIAIPAEANPCYFLRQHKKEIRISEDRNPDFQRETLVLFVSHPGNRCALLR